MDKVLFYSLTSMPTENISGAFLNLTEVDGDNQKGLYFCDSEGWRYLTNVEQDTANDVKSAKLYGYVVCFFNTTTPPSTMPSDPSEYLFKLSLIDLVRNGDGIAVSTNVVSLKLSDKSVLDGTTTPDIQANSHLSVGTDTLLKIDVDKKLSIGNTWSCGTFGSDGNRANNNRHVENLWGKSFRYCHVLKSSIPSNATISSVDSVPSTPSSGWSKYIKCTTNNWYYKLCAAPPQASQVLTGELSLSVSDGYERIFLKNLSGSFVEFAPYNHDVVKVGMTTLKNPQIIGAISSTSCTWNIPYSDITNAGILVNDSTFVVLREVSTGKQVVPDVTFDGTNQKIKISFASSGLVANKYIATITGQISE